MNLILFLLLSLYGGIYLLHKIIQSAEKSFIHNYLATETESYISTQIFSPSIIEPEIIEPEKEKIKDYMSNNFKPENFRQYIGQEKVKKIIQNYLIGCKERKRKFPHTLIFAKPGMGKTTLARIIAKVLKVNFVEIIGSKVKDDFKYFKEKVRELKGGVLFIDEIHALDRDIVEKLYPIMEDFILEEDRIKPFTLIGATTEMGEIIRDRKPFFDRFKLILQLADYEEKDIIKIIKQYKRRIFKEVVPKEWFYKSIAQNSRLTPRNAIRYLESGIYFKGFEDREKLMEMFKVYNIVYKGITETDIKILNYLNNFKDSKAVGIQELTAYLDTDKYNYLHYIEPYLLKQELLFRTSKGRIISDKGKELLRKIKRRRIT